MRCATEVACSRDAMHGDRFRETHSWTAIIARTAQQETSNGARAAGRDRRRHAMPGAGNWWKERELARRSRRAAGAGTAAGTPRPDDQCSSFSISSA
jgi:hypothetical protein